MGEKTAAKALQGGSMGTECLLGCHCMQCSEVILSPLVDVPHIGERGLEGEKLAGSRVTGSWVHTIGLTPPPTRWDMRPLA